MRKFCKLAIAAAIVSVLAACGGGGDAQVSDQELEAASGHRTTQPVDCKANPQLCG